MSLEAWLVIGVVLGVIGCLALTRIPADALLVSAITILMVVPLPGRGESGGWKMGILSTKDGLAGFANSGMITVAVLYMVVCGLRETGGVDWIAHYLLGRPRTARGALARVIVPTWGMSTFLNNTPVVAMLIPAVSDWAKRLRLSPSQLMIPLSYSAIMGGTCSLIGTSTNLVVAGLVIAHTDLGALGMFDITWVGLPSAVAGALFLIIAGPVLLPRRGGVIELLANPREYTLEMMLPEGSPLAGRTIEQAGLRSLPGCFLVEIEREGEVLAAIGRDQVLHAGDRLVFAGVVEAIRDLQHLRGLRPATDQVFKLDSPRNRRRLYELVISANCAMAGRTIREGRFRNVYDAAVLAVARNGSRIEGKIGDIMLRPGDALLIEAGPSFAEQHRNNRDFLLVSPLDDSTPRRHRRAPIAVAILVVMVLAATFEVVSMLHAALLASGLMILSRCCTVSEARRSIDWSVLIVIACALGLGQAMDVSGAADAIAGGLLSFAGTNPWLVLAAVYITTSLLTEIITNNAAVALIFPIALASAESLGVNFMPFVIAIMMAGSASFATPLGYQTNLMVYGPGGYTLGDFLRIGIPMNFVMGAVAILLSPIVFPF